MFAEKLMDSKVYHMELKNRKIRKRTKNKNLYSSGDVVWNLDGSPWSQS